MFLVLVDAQRGVWQRADLARDTRGRVVTEDRVVLEGVPGMPGVFEGASEEFVVLAGELSATPLRLPVAVDCSATTLTMLRSELMARIRDPAGKIRTLLGPMEHVAGQGVSSGATTFSASRSTLGKRRAGSDAGSLRAGKKRG